MIFVIGGTLAFFFEILLLSKRNKTLADKILAVWMLILGLHLFLFYFTYKGLDFKYTHLLGIRYPFPFLHWPMLFLYTASLTNYLKRFKLIQLLHFLPFLFFYVYYADRFVVGQEEKIIFINKIISGHQDIYTIYSYPVLILSVIIYFVLTFLLIKKHKSNIKEYYSYSNEKINLNWLKYLLIGMLVVWGVVIIATFGRDDLDALTPVYISVVLFVILIGYLGIKQGNIFVTQVLNSDVYEDNIANNNKKRYNKSGLKDKEIAKIQIQLTVLMEEEKIFKDQSLSLSKLAEKIGVISNYLSQVINERIGRNFYDYINYYRTEEFKYLVAKPENKKLTILALALDSGFASKGAFNKAFRKFAGQTPSEYVKSIRPNSKNGVL